MAIIERPSSTPALAGAGVPMTHFGVGTAELLGAMGEAGATVVEHKFINYAAQKNWGLDNLPLAGDWVFILDADERILAHRTHFLYALDPKTGAQQWRYDTMEDATPIRDRGDAAWGGGGGGSFRPPQQVLLVRIQAVCPPLRNGRAR